MTRRVCSLSFSFVFLACTVGAAGPDDAVVPSGLAASVASQLLAECGASRAKTAAISVAGGPGLEGSPATVATARVLEDRMFTTGLADAAPGVADCEVALVLSRTGGRIALGGAVRSKSGRSGWVLASEPETPSWAPWLAPLLPAPPDVAGFTWGRASAIDGDVLDADGGDLDGDGLAELVAVTRDRLTVFRLREGEIGIATSVALAPGDAADIATRAPRALVRVGPGAGGPGEVLLRFTDERRTRVFGWTNTNGGSLEPRADRDGVVLSARPTARGADLVTMEGLAPGTNHFVDPPKVKRGAAWKTPASLGAWLDLRDADLTATARIAEAGASFALLGADGALRLLRSDLSELSRVPSCGSAFALADWDADGKAEALCAGTAGSARDSLSLVTSGGATWTAAVDGAVVGLASGPQAGGSTAALAFVRNPEGSGTAVWLLTRRTP